MIMLCSVTVRCAYVRTWTVIGVISEAVASRYFTSGGICMPTSWSNGQLALTSMHFRTRSCSSMPHGWTRSDARRLTATLIGAQTQTGT